LKVAIIIPRLDQLGPVKVIQALVNSLYETDGFQVKLFYLDRQIDPNLKIKISVERLIWGKFHFADYDIVHTNGIRPDLYAFINRRKIRYHISTIHNFVFDDLAFSYGKSVSFLFGTLWLILWKRADKLVCVSSSLKDYYSKWFSGAKLEVIFNGIAEEDTSILPDNEIIQVINGFRSGNLKVLGSAGMLTRRKGIDLILFLLAEEKEYAMVVLGSGKELKNLKNLAKKLNITDRCLFCGFRSNAANYFKYFDFLVMPSRSEGFGLSLAEAAQQKIPVICSDLKVFKELYHQNEVLFFKQDDKDSLKSALRIGEKEGSSRAELAYLRYQNNYTDSVMSKKYLELYCYS